MSDKPVQVLVFCKWENEGEFSLLSVDVFFDRAAAEAHVLRFAHRPTSPLQYRAKILESGRMVKGRMADWIWFPDEAAP